MEERQQEIGTLFKKDKSKWINGRYYTEQQLKIWIPLGTCKNDGFFKPSFFTLKIQLSYQVLLLHLNYLNEVYLQRLNKVHCHK